MIIKCCLIINYLIVICFNLARPKVLSLRFYNRKTITPYNYLHQFTLILTLNYEINKLFRPWRNQRIREYKEMGGRVRFVFLKKKTGKNR